MVVAAKVTCFLRRGGAGGGASCLRAAAVAPGCVCGTGAGPALTVAAVSVVALPAELVSSSLSPPPPLTARQNVMMLGQAPGAWRRPAQRHG